MITRKKYIAFVLFGIFIFPILFQPFHIVWHHAHGYHCEHHVCQHKKPGKKFHNNHENISKKEEVCPICDYEFSINDLPKSSLLGMVIPVISCTYSEIITPQHYIQIYSNKTPRAPPTHHS